MKTDKASKCWHEAPFDEDGHQLSYPEWRSEMRPVEPFEDTLTFEAFSRGRSSALGVFTRRDGREVVMFMTDK